jgi:hypothetical protein
MAWRMKSLLSVSDRLASSLIASLRSSGSQREVCRTGADGTRLRTRARPRNHDQRGLRRPLEDELLALHDHKFLAFSA